jgi:hypothetical protein
MEIHNGVIEHITGSSIILVEDCHEWHGNRCGPRGRRGGCDGQKAARSKRSYFLQEGRAMKSNTLILANLWWVLSGALVFLAAVLYAAFLRELLGFAYLNFLDIAICFMAAIASILWFEGLKIIKGRKGI